MPSKKRAENAQSSTTREAGYGLGKVQLPKVNNPNKRIKSGLTADSASVDPATSSTTEGFRFLDLPGELRNEIMFKWLLPTPESPAYIHIGSREYRPPELYTEALTLEMYRTCKKVYQEIPKLEDLLANGSFVLYVGVDCQGPTWNYDGPKGLARVLHMAARLRLVFTDDMIYQPFNYWNISADATMCMNTWLDASSSLHRMTLMIQDGAGSLQDHHLQPHLPQNIEKVLEFSIPFANVNIRHVQPWVFLESLIPRSLNHTLLRNLHKIEPQVLCKKFKPEWREAVTRDINNNLRTVATRAKGGREDLWDLLSGSY